MGSIVAIIGRPNTGKSTLFNRILGKRIAIVENIPGVTRDRLYGTVNICGKVFTFVDTGGFDPQPNEPLVALMKEQAEAAMTGADAIVLLMDAKEGLNPVDVQLYRLVAGSNKPAFITVNKVDNLNRLVEAAEFYSLGAKKIHFISALHGRGVQELLRNIVDIVPCPDSLPLQQKDKVVRVAVVGKPNVGKSTLINKLLGQTRLLTSEMPGTTRDSVDVELILDDKRSIIFVDTAGQRKRKRIRSRLELYSVLRAIRSIETCEVAFLLLDATCEVGEQDARIANLIEEKGKAWAFIFNKWDAVEKSKKIAAQLITNLRARFPLLAHAPVMFVSAKTGKGADKLPSVAFRLKKESNKRISTGRFNRFTQAMVKRNPPPLFKHKEVKILYASQVDVQPPTFVFHVNYPEGITKAYKRYLVNRLREEFGFSGVPIRILIRT